MRRALKLVLLVWLGFEWYTRGGRDFLFGEDVSVSDGRMKTMRIIVHVAARAEDVRARAETLQYRVPFRPIDRLTHNETGWVGEILEIYDGAETGSNVLVEFDRGAFGWPIHVATAQAEYMTRHALAG